MKIIDITLPISDETPVWEGEKGVSIFQTMRIEKGEEYNVSRCELGLHSGTHIDAPFHALANGSTVDEIPLKKLTGAVQVIKVPDDIKVINEKCLCELNIDPKIKKILLKTANSDYWDEDPVKFHNEYAALDRSGAEHLVLLEMDLVGIDYFSISIFNDLRKPHEILLENNIVILENTDLRNAVPGVYQLFCLPLKVIGTDGAPVRAILTEL